jgi:hypothetical protein
MENQRKYAFGTSVDPVEAGRAGGVASGESRRRKPLRVRALERKIAETGNGAALLGLKRDVERRQTQPAPEVERHDPLKILAAMPDSLLANVFRELGPDRVCAIAASLAREEGEADAVA